MNGFIKGILILVLMAGCGISLFAVNSAEKLVEQRQAIELVKAEGIVSQDFDNHALDTNQEIAQGGYAGIVAVAVSGDVAQTAIVQSYNGAIIAVSLMVVALIGFMIYNGRKKEKDNYVKGLAYNPTSEFQPRMLSKPSRRYDPAEYKYNKENYNTVDLPVNEYEYDE